MLPPEILAIANALINAGGWAAFLVVVIAATVALFRGTWVPGFIYRRELERANTATIQQERNADAIEDLTDVLAHRPPRRRRNRAATG